MICWPVLFVCLSLCPNDIYLLMHTNAAWDMGWVLFFSFYLDQILNLRFTSLCLGLPMEWLTIYSCIVLPTLVFPWFLFISLIVFIVALLRDLKSNTKRKWESEKQRWELGDSVHLLLMANHLTFRDLCFLIDKTVGWDDFQDSFQILSSFIL